MSPLPSEPMVSASPQRPSSTSRRPGRRGGTRGAEDDWSSGETRLESPIWLVSLSVQELTLISENWLHNFPFFEVKNHARPSPSSSIISILKHQGRA